MLISCLQFSLDFVIGSWLFTGPWLSGVLECSSLQKLMQDMMMSIFSWILAQETISASQLAQGGLEACSQPPGSRAWWPSAVAWPTSHTGGGKAVDTSMVKSDWLRGWQHIVSGFNDATATEFLDLMFTCYFYLGSWNPPQWIREFFFNVSFEIA